MSRFQYPLNPDQMAAIVRMADVSDRTVRRHFRGCSMSASTLRRIGAALRAIGRGDLARDPLPKGARQPEHAAA